MAEDQLNEITWNLVNSFQDASRAVSDNMIAAQERNLKFAQSMFVNGMEVLRNQTESTRSLIEEFGKQAQKQQDAYQRLVYASVNSFMDLLSAPLSYTRQMLDTAESVTQRGLEEYSRKATEQ